MRGRPAIIGVFFGAIVLAGGQAWGARPSAEEMALRDHWVRDRFPVPPAGVTSAPASSPEAGLMVWTNYGPVLCNTVNGRPLQVGEQAFEHGIYCHAPSKVQVFLPGPGRSLSAATGILSNSDSQGGSVVFSVAVGEKGVHTSPVQHRGEHAIPLSVDLGGAREFFLSVGCAGDGISSDQAVWANTEVILADGRTLRLGDLPLCDALSRNRSVAASPFSFYYGGRPSDEILLAWEFQEQRDTSKSDRTTRVQTFTDPKTGLIVRCTIVEYADFPTVEWALAFENSGDHDTPILSGILPLDTRLERGVRVTLPNRPDAAVLTYHQVK